MRKVALAFAALLGVSLSAACTSSDVTDDSAAKVVTVTNYAFTPQNLTIKVGQTVRWVWEGGAHNVVSGSSCTDDGKFRSFDPNQTGGTFDHTFAVAGTFPYYCEPHCTSNNMVGTITVTP